MYRYNLQLSENKSIKPMIYARDMAYMVYSVALINLRETYFVGDFAFVDLV